MGIQERHEREKEQRRAAILEAAREELKQNGYSGMTIENIAKRAELAKGTIYLYFKDKEDITNTMLIEANREILEIVSTSAKQAKTGRDQLVYAARKFLRFRQNNVDIFFYTMLMERFAEFRPERKAAIYDSFSQYREFFLSVLEKGKKDGSFRPDIDSEKLAEVFLHLVTSFMQRLSSFFAFLPNYGNDTDLLEYLFLILFAGLVKDSNTIDMKGRL